MHYYVTFACTAHPLNARDVTHVRGRTSHSDTPTIEAIARLTAPRLRRWWRQKSLLATVSYLVALLIDSQRHLVENIKWTHHLLGAILDLSTLAWFTFPSISLRGPRFIAWSPRFAALSLGESPNLDKSVTGVICAPLLRKKLPCFTMLYIAFLHSNMRARD